MLEFTLTERAQHDHPDVPNAMPAREGARAEAIMREHARLSCSNKREMVLRLKQSAKSCSDHWHADTP